jgi:hypothetical protein
MFLFGLYLEVKTGIYRFTHFKFAKSFHLIGIDWEAVVWIIPLCSRKYLE